MTSRRPHVHEGVLNVSHFVDFEPVHDRLGQDSGRIDRCADAESLDNVARERLTHGGVVQNPVEGRRVPERRKTHRRRVRDVILRFAKGRRQQQVAAPAERDLINLNRHNYNAGPQPGATAPLPLPGVITACRAHRHRVPPFGVASGAIIHRHYLWVHDRLDLPVQRARPGHR